MTYEKLRSLASYSQEDVISEIKYFNNRISSPDTIARNKKKEGIFNPYIAIEGMN